HMLDQIARHGAIDLTVKAKGDLHIDEHHTIEDTGIALGEIFLKVLGDKRGIERYAYTLPMDDCLAQVAIDFGGRNWIVWEATFNREKIRSEEHTSELQSRENLVCRLLLETKTIVHEIK